MGTREMYPASFVGDPDPEAKVSPFFFSVWCYNNIGTADTSLFSPQIPWHCRAKECSPKLLLCTHEQPHMTQLRKGQCLARGILDYSPVLLTIRKIKPYNKSY